MADACALPMEAIFDIHKYRGRIGRGRAGPSARNPLASERRRVAVIYISGEARMTVFAAEEKARTFNFRAREVGYVPMSMALYVENTGEQLLRFLELFRADRFNDVSLAQWMAPTCTGSFKITCTSTRGSQIRFEEARSQYSSPAC